MDNPVPSSMPKPDLFSKIGPLPAWAWGAVVVVGYLAYKHFSGGSATAVQVTDSPVDSTTTDGTDGTIVDQSNPDSYDPSTSGYNYSDVLEGNYTGTTAGTGTSFSTNQQWAISCISNMSKMGMSSSLVTTAITLYLAGQSLTPAEASVVSLAITDFGPPPLPLPVSVTPAPVTPTAPVVAKPVAKPVAAKPVAAKPKPKPAPAPKTYVVKSGDTLTSIAKAHGTTVAHLVAINGIANPNKIRAGQTIKL
jgi:LysM repeat protein